MSGPCVGVVSIQRDGAGDAVDRHLSWGMLVDADAVIVPAPLDWLRDPDVTFQVLIASARRTGPGLVERIQVRSATTIGLAAQPDGAAAMLRLAQPSAHRPFAEGFDSAAIEAALGADPDVWTALEITGVLPADVRTFPVSEVLGPVSIWERDRRENLVRDRIDTPGGVIGILCCWIIRCNRCETCAGPWW
jgi:hypothetical protein